MVTAPAYSGSNPQTAEPNMQENELRRQIGARIKLLRKQHNWTLKQLAERLGVRYQQLNKYESGLNTPPADKLILLSEIFQTSVDFLLTGERSESKPLHNLRLLERFQAMEGFGQEDQEVVLRLIDAMIVKNKVESALQAVNRQAV